jgi:predicted metal-binding protein
MALLLLEPLREWQTLGQIGHGTSFHGDEMKQIGIIRCEKNETRCPMTSCLKALDQGREGFQGEGELKLMGVFTCRCPGGGVADMARILKSKGAEQIHFCTCMFAHKDKDGWIEGDGLCPHAADLARDAARAAGIPCVLGAAHLPEGYRPEIFT